MFSLCNMADGVLPRNMRIEHMVNTEDPTDVDMEREDLGQMTSTFLRGHVENAQLKTSVACFRSFTAANGTTVVPE